MIQLKDDIKLILNSLLDEIWIEKSDAIPTEEPIAKSLKFNANGERIKVIIAWQNDGEIIIRIKQN